MNHSFVPSTSIRHLPLVPSVVALRDLAEGDEIHFDYQSNELPMACPFECDGVVICGKNTTTTNTANEDGSCRKDKTEEAPTTTTTTTTTTTAASSTGKQEEEEDRPLRKVTTEC